MTTQADTHAQIAELKRLVTQLEEQRADAPRAYQSAITLGLKWAALRIDALEAGDSESITMLDADRLRAPKWARHLLEVDQFIWGIEGGSLKPMGELVGRPDEIWVRWDAIPVELRDAAASAASILADGVSGHRATGGRGRKKRT